MDMSAHVVHTEPDGSFSVCALVWRPGQVTPIHDHVTWCVFGVLQGAEYEEIYALGTGAVILRDRCCAFPGCGQPPAACQVHHIRPRSKGGATSLRNMVLLCRFHHLIAVHRWGWQIALHPDGTVTATSPDGQRTLHSHGPPPALAA